MIFLLTILIPLLIAGRQRKSLFEVTRSGTVLAVILVISEISVFMITNIIVGINGFIEEPESKVRLGRVAILLLMIAALLPTYTLAKMELKKFDWRQ